jgi:beta-galactosidase
MSVGLVSAGLMLCAAVENGGIEPPRVHSVFDFDWRFTLGDPRGAQWSGFDDSAWRTLNLPHDWSVEGPFAEDNPSGSPGGYAPGGVGWYRKHFPAPRSWEDKRVSIEFDGVFADSDVWINDHYLGRQSRPIRYLGFELDLTQFLRFDAPNVLAVRVDNTCQPYSRWYTGCGIFRHVWLTVTDSLHVAHWGTYVTTPEITETSAVVRLRTTLRNESAKERTCSVHTRIVDPEGHTVAEAASSATAPPLGQVDVAQKWDVPNPALWSIESPQLYRAVSEVREADRPADRYETPFGIRTVRFDPNHGFLLNGRKVPLRGVCIHHDAGALGAAVPDRAIERRLSILKSLGFNAVRLSHNPHTPQLLDLCDRMGVVLIDEAYDKWPGFTPWGDRWRGDLQRFIERDRNHPSVILWSVGNEVVPEQFHADGAKTLEAMVNFVHHLEPSRLVTCALHPQRQPGYALSPMADVMDVVSLNYQSELYEKDHREHPEMVLLESEHAPYYAFSFEGPDPAKLDHYVRDDSWLHIPEYVAGQFVWAGYDYLGESPGWPTKGWPVGLIDTAGFPKDYAYFFKSLFAEKPMVHTVVIDDTPKDKPTHKYWDWTHMVSHWNWSEPGKTLKVAAFTNCPVVELTLNGEAFGEKRLADAAYGMPTWDVPYEPGTLEVRGKRDGETLCSYELRTAGPPARLVLECDRTTLAADGQDVAHVVALVVDAQGIRVPDAETLVHFEVSGPGAVVGVDNGDLSDPSSYKGCRRETRRGRCLTIVQAGRTAGAITVSARAEGFEPASAVVHVESSGTKTRG